MDAKKLKLDEIAEIQIGYQSREKIEERPDGEYFLIRSQDIDDCGRLNLTETMPFSPKIDPDRYLVFTGDILIQARGQTHCAYLIDNAPENLIASNTFYTIRIKPVSKVLPGYLAWWLNQPKVQNYFIQEQGISTIPFVSKTTLASTIIHLPRLSLQEKIIQLMGLRDQEAELITQLSNKKDLLLQSVMQNAINRQMETSQDD